MENFLVALALVLQTADAAATCRVLRDGGREQNPVIPRSCAGVVAYKAASLAAIPLVPRGRWRLAVAGANASAGGLGLSLTVAWR